MRTELFWIPGPWDGRPAIAPRPRGGDWLEGEMQAWHRAGVDVVVSLLTPEEHAELDLLAEENLCRANGIEFKSFPIEDRAVPSSPAAFTDLLTVLAARLTNGKNVAVHCRQGIGRAAVVAVCLLVWSGMETDTATVRVGSARGCSVPETPGQQRWVADFAKSLKSRPPK